MTADGASSGEQQSDCRPGGPGCGTLKVLAPLPYTEPTSAFSLQGPDLQLQTGPSPPAPPSLLLPPIEMSSCPRDSTADPPPAGQCGQEGVINSSINNSHLLNAYDELGTVLSILNALSQLIHTVQLP